MSIGHFRSAFLALAVVGLTTASADAGCCNGGKSHQGSHHVSQHGYGWGAYQYQRFGHRIPGAYGVRVGSPYYYSNSSNYDNGPFYGSAYGAGNYGVGSGCGYGHGQSGSQWRPRIHPRVPYYNYRAPWYYPGPAIGTWNTNIAW